MRNWYWAVAAVITLGAVIFFYKNSASTPPPSSPQETVKEATVKKPVIKAEVLMNKDVFEPETLTIKTGTTVEFKNTDSVTRWPASSLHPTHTIYPEFDPRQPIEVGQSWSFTFDKAGGWKYHDHLAPSIRGTIVVTD